MIVHRVLFDRLLCIFLHFILHCRYAIRSLTLLLGGLNFSALGEESHVSPIGMAGVSFENIIGKEDIGDMVLINVVNHITGEVAGVNDMYFFEGKEEIARECIAETIL